MAAPRPRRARPVRLRAQLTVALGGMLAAVLLAAAFGVLLLHRTADDFERVAEEVVAESAAAERLSEDLAAAQRSGAWLLEERDPVAARALARVRPNVERRLARLRGLDEPEERRQAARVAAAWRRGVRLIDLPPGATVADTADGRLDTEDVFENELQRAQAAVLALRRAAAAEIARQLAASNAAESRDWRALWIALAVGLAVAGLLARALTRSVLGPLERLQVAAGAYGEGRLDARVEGPAPAELGQVGDALNAMAGALAESRARLERLAFTDALTGLPNRAGFTADVTTALARRTAGGREVALLFVDLDGFKVVNDDLGHLVGDDVLVEAAARVRGCLQPGQRAARLGGDEFAVLLEGAPADAAAMALADRLVAALRRPFVVGAVEFFVQASVGVAVRGADDEATPRQLLREADLAMYHAKEQGGGRVERYRPELRDATAGHLAALADLRRALERDELVVHLQPVVDLGTGAVHAVEALVRWQHPTRGLLAPAAFLPLAERSGLVVPLGAWVLDQACAQAAAWGPAGPAVTVNLSARQLREPGLVDAVAGVLRAHALAPRRLVLELTETAMTDDLDAGIAVLERLRALGVRIAVDDFGEGRSSLGSLRRLPVDVVKVARPVVAAMLEGPRDAAVARGVVELARSLGVPLVAEGVEREEQAERVRALGCELGQGFLFARPLPGDAVAALLAAGRPLAAV